MSHLLASAALTLSVALSGVAASAQDAETDLPADMKCGAAGDGCQSEEWQAYNLAVSRAYPDWPEVAFRIYAGECEQASKKMKETCLKNPKKAAAALGLDQ